MRRKERKKERKKERMKERKKEKTNRGRDIIQFGGREDLGLVWMGKWKCSTLV